MAIVDFISGLSRPGLPSLKKIHLDDFQQRVRSTLYIELPQSGDTVCTLTPNLHPVGNQLEKRVERLLAEKADILDYLKERLLATIVIDTCLLETSTYYITQNDHLLLARFKRFIEEEDILEIKLYTATAEELKKRYSDKIYVGRCFLKPHVAHLPWDGLNLYVLSLMDQFECVKSMADGRLDKPDEYIPTYFQEIGDLLSDVASEVVGELESLPKLFQPSRWALEEKVRVKAAYRSMVHLFIELLDAVGELENALFFGREDRFVRYVTKYRQDLKNIVNYLNFKVLSSLSRSIQAD